jgi:hypothetical protein
MRIFHNGLPLPGAATIRFLLLLTPDEHDRFRRRVLSGMVTAIRHRADAAIVVDGNADDVIVKLQAEGWTLEPGEEDIGGKRLRIMRTPA